MRYQRLAPFVLFFALTAFAQGQRCGVGDASRLRLRNDDFARLPIISGLGLSGCALECRVPGGPR
jgi:hypothetical protein